MLIIRRTLGSTAGKVLALPAMLVTIVLAAAVAFTVDDQVRGGGPCGSAIYDKSATVFGAITICGTSDVAQDKVAHAAAVAAQWLDNDQDGVADEPRLIEELKSTDPIVMMTPSGISVWPGIRTIFARRGIQSTQDLGAQETNPDGDRRDASQEEIHHLIVNAGWQRLFPQTFSETQSDQSTLFTAWQTAESEGLYSYDDPTCDNSCKVTEFVYLATAAYLGSDADLENEELRIPNQTRLREQAPTVVEIFESSDWDGVRPGRHA